MTARTDTERDLERLGEMVALLAGAGVVGAGVAGLLASADAFNARLAAASQHSAQLSTLQIRSLANCLADLRSPPTSYVRRTVRRTLPPGAPVVT